jgi:hypothetical protein
MNASIAELASAEVSASLLYLGKAPERPLSYVSEPPPGTPRDNSEYEARRVTIVDARLTASSLSVDRNGFELWDAPSTVDFLDEDELVRRYYPEIAELALRVTGGSQAHVFDHLIRRRELGRPPMTLGAYRGGHAGPAGRVHNDYTEESGRRRFGLVLPGQTPRRRYCIVNLWRSIGPAPVLDTPLAVCDARTVAQKDLTASEIRFPGRVGEIYLVRYAAEHAWSYFSEMRRDEVLVFKQYDSALGVARFTPHAAFDHPGMPRDAAPRISLEIRCLVTFE